MTGSPTVSEEKLCKLVRFPAYFLCTNDSVHKIRTNPIFIPIASLTRQGSKDESPGVCSCALG